VTVRRLAAALVVFALGGATAGRALAEPAHRAGARQSFENGIVGLTVSAQGWDQDRPWAKGAPQARMALATVVEGPYLLTSAQMVADATLIEAEKLGGSVRVPARVVLVDPEVDLAILGVDSPKFFDDLKPVPLASSVPTEGAVQSVRWRLRQIEASTSRVSRVEVQVTSLGGLEHPFLLVTTDLRGGGWAEPVLAEGRLVGLTVSQDEQVARVLPVDIISNFLEMARGPKPYPGFANLGLRWQINEDPVLTASLRLPGDPHGVLITGANWGGSSCGILRPRDLLLSLDGHEIDASGYYRHPRYGLLRFTTITTDGHRAGETIKAEVWRDGKDQKLDLPLKAAHTPGDLIPDRVPEQQPPYLVAGGLVLRELDGNYLRSWGDDWRRKAPIRLQLRYWLDSKDQEPGSRRIVVLSSVLPHAYNIGYHGLSDVAVLEINGRPVDSIAAAEEAFKHPEGDFHRIVLEPNGQMAQVILDAKTFEAATAEIQESYRVPAPVRTAAPPPEFGAACGG
jgi:S1-C subfamily serine protease